MSPKKIALVIAAVASLAIIINLLKLAYEHRGFFVYHYQLLTSKNYTTYQNELLELTKTSPREAFKRYREILKIDPLSYNTCHGIAHQMGHTAYESLGFQKAMQFQDALCGGGYIHGIIEARFGLLQESEILKEVATICDEDNRPCYHGIGHGLMVATKLNIGQSLRYCDRLPELGRRNCYDGVWMHRFDLEESGARETPSAVTKPDQQATENDLSLCLQTPKAYKSSCYFYLPRIFAHAQELDFNDFASLCNAVEPDGQIACAAGTGHAVMKYHIAEPEISMNRCLGFESAPLKNACKEGSALYYLFAAEAPTESPCLNFTNEQDRAICRKVDAYRGDL